MFNLKKFYVSYLQDCGYGAGMWCHFVIEAPDLEYAKEHWAEMSPKGYAFSPIGSKPYEYEELFEVPNTLSEEEIFKIYG